MNLHILRSLAVILVLSVAPGCSIKEERGDCPCRLFLDMTYVDVVDQSPVVLHVMSEDGFEYKAELNAENFNDTCVIDVPRKNLDVVLWSGGGGNLDEDGLKIPLGHDCPPVYIHASVVEADYEAVYETVRLRKNYCILNVSFVNPEDVKALKIRGEVAGFDVSGSPSYGEFSVSSIPDSTSGLVGRFYVPRQNGAPLYLDVIETDGFVKSFPLHVYLSEFGYRWDENDLNDINILLEYTPLGVIIRLQGWGEEMVIRVVI